MNYALVRSSKAVPAIAKKEPGSRVAWSKPTIAFTNSVMPTPLKSGVKMSLSAVCTAWAQGTLFCGESMFSRMENASKTALRLVDEFIRHGGKLIDCQVLNDHTASLGACEIPRRDYLNYLNQMRLGRLPNNFWVPRCLFSPQDECFRHISPQSVIIAVAELVTLITPLPIRNFSRQVTPIVYLTAPLYVALLVRLSRVFSE